MKVSIQHLVLSILTCLTLAACSGDNAAKPPELIALPNAFRPEGIAASGGFIYVGGRFKLQMHHFEQRQRPQWVSDSQGIFVADCSVARQLFGLPLP